MPQAGRARWTHSAGSRIGRGQTQPQTVAAHDISLVGTEAQVGAGLAGAQQDEPGLTILEIVRDGVVLIDSAGTFQAAGAGQTTALVADGRQDDAGLGRRVPDVLVGAHLERAFALGQKQRNPVRVGRVRMFSAVGGLGSLAAAQPAWS